MRKYLQKNRFRFGSFGLLVLILIGLNLKQVESVGLPLSENKAETWCYWQHTSCNPNNWPGLCATGKMQSPINLNINTVTSKATLHNTYEYPLVHFYGQQHLTYSSFGIANGGHSVVITAPTNKEPPTIISPFILTRGRPYTFAQMHFHTGYGNKHNGSEHSVNGKLYDGELHLVHYATKYGSFSKAVAAKKDNMALLVIGILLKVANNPNPNLDPIINSLHYVQNYVANQKPVQIRQELSIGGLFPKNLNFFRYHGSLTTPACEQKVIWVVHKEPIPISLKQLTALGQVKNAEGDPLVQNFRNLQPRNGRKIRYFTVKTHSC